MLKTLLMLALQWAPSPEAGTDKVELALLSGGAPGADAEMQLLQLEARNVFDLADSVAPDLVGSSADDFEARLLDLFDDERLADLLGGFIGLSIRVFSMPQVEAYLGVPGFAVGLTPQHPIAARLISDGDAFSAALGGESALLEQFRLRGHEFSVPMLGVEPRQIARALLEAVYDPAATAAMSAYSRSVVRLVARLLVVRHLVRTDANPTPEYVEGLFSRSKRDYETIAGPLAAWLGVEPPAGVAPFDIRADGMRYRYNRAMLTQAMEIVERDDSAWDTIFSDERDVGRPA